MPVVAPCGVDQSIGTVTVAQSTAGTFGGRSVHGFQSTGATRAVTSFDDASFDDVAFDDAASGGAAYAGTATVGPSATATAVKVPRAVAIRVVPFMPASPGPTR
jgi:hypothetical protein